MFEAIGTAAFIVITSIVVCVAMILAAIVTIIYLDVYFDRKKKQDPIIRFTSKAKGREKRSGAGDV